MADMTRLEELLEQFSTHDAALARIAELEALLREWAIWHAVTRYGCTQVQAERAVAGQGRWPDDEPTAQSLPGRTIAALATQ